MSKSATREVRANNYDGIYLYFSELNKLVIEWGTSQAKKDVISRYFQQRDSGLTMRVFDVSPSATTSLNKTIYTEIYLPDGQDHWLLSGPRANKSYLIQIGTWIESHYFFPFHESKRFRVIEENGRLLCEGTTPWDTTFIEHALPVWTERVSTYSYYENISSEGWVKK